MSKINLQNYEAFYLDYLEGNLAEEDIVLFEKFLAKNPHLQNDFEDFDSLSLDAKKETFDKSILFQKIDKDSVEEFIISNLENEIDADSKAELNAYLETDKEAQLLAARYKKTILPDTKITYADKHALKKKTPVLYLIGPATGIAAALLLFFMFKSPEENKHTASVTTPIKVEELKPVEKLDDNEELKGESDAKPDLNIKASKLNKSSERLANVKVTKIEPEVELKIQEHPVILPAENLALEEDPNVGHEIETSEEIVENGSQKLASIDMKAVEGFSQKEIAMTIPEWANEKIEKEVLNTHEDKKGIISASAVLNVVGDKVGDLTKDNVVIAHAETPGRRKFSISIGKFGFSTSKGQ